MAGRGTNVIRHVWSGRAERSRGDPQRRDRSSRSVLVMGPPFRRRGLQGGIGARFAAGHSSPTASNRLSISSAVAAFRMSFTTAMGFPRSVFSVAEVRLPSRPQRFVRGEGSRARRDQASAGPSPRALPRGANRRPSRTLPADCASIRGVRLSYATHSKHHFRPRHHGLHKT